jgi:hypothetical protein
MDNGEKVTGKPPAPAPLALGMVASKRADTRSDDRSPDIHRAPLVERERIS